MTKIQKWLGNNVLLIVLVALVTFTSLFNGTFLSRTNLTGMFNQISIMTMLAIGMTFVILTGGIDLSVGATAGLGTVIIACVMRDNAGGNPALVCVLAVLATLAATSAIGLLNGLLVTRMNLPPIIITLSMTWVATGLGETLIKGTPLTLALGGVKDVLGYRLFDWIPVMLVLALAFLACAAYMLKNLRFGRELYAVGSSRYAAYISGMKTRRVITRAYLLSGLCAGIAGVFIAANLNSGYAKSAVDYELYSIAAVVMGGVSLTGGKGRILNAFWGVLLLRILNKLVVFTGLSNLSGFIEGSIIGAVLLGVLFMNAVKKGDERA